MNIYSFIQRLPKTTLGFLTTSLMTLFAITGHYHDAISTWEIYNELKDCWPQ